METRVLPVARGPMVVRAVLVVRGDGVRCWWGMAVSAVLVDGAARAVLAVVAVLAARAIWG